MTTTVLVVDDEDDIRFLARMILESAECAVLEAADGAEAIEAIERHPVDLVLLDLRMSGIDGWGVLERLRDAGHLPGLPVVVLSAHAEPEVLEGVIAEGCRGFVRKPFRPEELVATISLASGS